MRFLASLVLILTADSPQLDIPVHPPQRPIVYPSILLTAEQAQLSMANFVVIDVRAQTKYLAGHIPGAIPVARVFARQPREIGPADEVLLYGDEESYENIAWTYFRLELRGHESIRILDGGYPAWEGAVETVPSQRVEELPPVGRSHATEVSVVSEKGPQLVDDQWVLARLNQPDIQLVDVRHFETVQPPSALSARDFRGGHIPLALPYDFRQLLPGDAYWPSPQAARKEFSHLGPRPREQVDLEATFVLYGANADSLSPHLGYLLLRLMGLDAKVFEGGWEGWIENPSRPRVEIVSDKRVADLRSNGGAVVLDLRDELDYRRSHIHDAVNLPAYRFKEDLTQMVLEDQLTATTPLVLYCYGPTCTRSRNGSAAAAEMGFSRLYWFQAGLEAWEAAGRPVERDPLPPSTTKVFDEPATAAEHPK